jgi:hypothetical protein
MTTNFHNFGRTVLSLVAALLIGTTFVAAAAGPALVTPATNSVILA